MAADGVVARAMRSAFALSLPFALVLVTGSASTARAGGGDDDAERLFREGQKLMEERRFGEACPKFEQAYAKDRQLGTLINLAFCHKEQGAIWYAWLEFKEAEVKATEGGRLDRRDFAKQRLAELEKQLPKVVLENPSRMPLTEVLVEDRKVWEAERLAVFAAESGQRKFTFKAKGKKHATALINVVKGDKVQRVTVPEMEDGSDDPPPVPERPIPEPPKGEAAGPAADPNAGSTQRTLGWVGIGVGSVALIVGIVEGALTFGSPCAGAPKKGCSTQEHDSATSTATIANLAFVLGGVGIIGGGALVLTAPSGSKSAGTERGLVKPRSAGVAVTPRIGAGWAGLSGTF